VPQVSRLSRPGLQPSRDVTDHPTVPQIRSRRQRNKILGGAALQELRKKRRPRFRPRREPALSRNHDLATPAFTKSVKGWLPAYSSFPHWQQVGPQQDCGFTARMNALMTFPSTCGAIASTSMSWPQRNSRASSTR
jgi:hypothetical protein